MSNADALPTFQTVLLDRVERVLRVTLNRPDKLNAVDPTLHDELPAALAWANRDPGSEVVVLTGAGRAFCAGGDIDAMLELHDGTAFWTGTVHHPGRHLIDQILWVEKPIVAMVNGPAAGLGATIALLCDVVMMAESAMISDRHVNIGLVAGDGGAAIWPLLVGINKAKEHLMTGAKLTGTQAAADGLVNHCVPDDQLEAATLALANTLAGQPRYALRSTKASINRQLRAQVETVLDVSLALEALSATTEDHKALTAAFTAARSTPA
jgi:enoyl-CoA hydratase